MQDNLGTIRVAPGVLSTIVSVTTLAVPGVTGMNGNLVGGMSKFISRGSANQGVKIQVREDAVFVDVYIVVEPGVNMLQVGNRIQQDVTEAIETMVGMPVREVNVFIQDVR
ncbi:MAG: Asp23/Gls24 family envelope stress response protein [Dehalococcoidia bacterium]|nr:Asp23/Gls24 family envelope stress response protein [Dehalococcoidia bacterium]